MKHARNSGGQICNTSVRTVTRTVTVGRKGLKSLFQSKVSSAVEATRHGRMTDLVDETICNAFTTGYCTTADGIKKYYFSLAENLIKDDSQWKTG